MVEFIRDYKPTDSQMILSFVDDAGVDLGGTEIVLENKWSLLQEDMYDQVDEEIRPFIDAHLLAP